MTWRWRVIAGLISGIAAGAALALVLIALGLTSPEGRWPVVVICAVNGAALGAWGLRWVCVSNEYYGGDE